MMTPARSPSGTKYGKLTTFKETFAFCPWQGPNHDQGERMLGKALNTSCLQNAHIRRTWQLNLLKCFVLSQGSGWPRRELKMVEELLIKVGMLIIVFWLAENTKDETDFIRGEV